METDKGKAKTSHGDDKNKTRQDCTRLEKKRKGRTSDRHKKEQDKKRLDKKTGHTFQTILAAGQ